jgi:hypothetical protein
LFSLFRSVRAKTLLGRSHGGTVGWKDSLSRVNSEELHPPGVATPGPQDRAVRTVERRPWLMPQLGLFVFVQNHGCFSITVIASPATAVAADTRAAVNFGRQWFLQRSIILRNRVFKTVSFPRLRRSLVHMGPGPIAVEVFVPPAGTARAVEARPILCALRFLGMEAKYLQISLIDGKLPDQSPNESHQHGKCGETYATIAQPSFIVTYCPFPQAKRPFSESSVQHTINRSLRFEGHRRLDGIQHMGCGYRRPNATRTGYPGERAS